MMRLVTWNCRRATKRSRAWDYLLDLRPDVALLQEVSSIPEWVRSSYQCAIGKARGKSGKEQRFGTAILVRGSLVAERPLRSVLDWVNRELDHFDGNVLSFEASVCNRRVLVVAVYSPAWHIEPERLAQVNTNGVRLTEQDTQVWVADLVWDALRHTGTDEFDDVVVGGDFNLSETFDTCWGGGPRGNAEYLRRMEGLGFTECLRHTHGALVPTFRNPRGGKIAHQMDHLFVSDPLSRNLEQCTTGEHEEVFGPALSDHLPIIADFRDQLSANRAGRRQAS